MHAHYCNLSIRLFMKWSCSDLLQKIRQSFRSLLAMLVLVCGIGAGQTLEKGAISGTVFDPSGAVIPGADVTVINASTGAERLLASNDGGRFRADILTAGEYVIEVSMPGFARTIVEGVVLSIGQELIEDVTLQLEAVGQVITVQSGTGRMDRSETRVNTAINNEYVENLPISGRDFRDFANLSPTADTTPGLRSTVRLQGQRGEYTGLIIDGVDNRNSFFGEWFGSLETKNFTVPQDAIQEFQVRDTGLSAEFGHATGGLINVVTKSGTNDWHGSAHWFFQSNTFIADTSVPAKPETTIAPALNTRHQFGGTVGGPIARDKAFLFLALDAQQQKGPLTAIFARDVSASPCPCPIPALFGVATLSDLERGSSQRQDLTAVLTKFDYKLTPNHTATTRLNYTRNENDNFTGLAGSQTFVLGRVESNFENFVNEGWTAAQSITSLLGNASVNELRLSYAQEVKPRRQRAPGPETSITDTGNFGRAFFLPIDSQHKRYQVIDSFSRTFGKHDLKLGGDLNSNATNQTFIGFAGGVYTFFSLEDFVARTPAFLLQRVGINGISVAESGTLQDFWQHELSFFVQDNWRMHPDFNLNLGLRWDGVWNPSSTFGLPGATLPAGRPRVNGNRVSVDLAPASSDVPDDFNNFAPRVGFAWDVGGRRTTIVRGGTGVYYATSPTIFFAGMLSGPGLRAAVVFVPFFGSLTDLTGFGLSYPDLLPSTATPDVEGLIGPPAIDYVDPNFQSARVINGQIGIEQQIAGDLSVTGTYTFNRSANLRTGGFFSTPWDRNLDSSAATLDQYGRTVGGFNLPRLDPNVGNANAIASFGEAEYHALIVQLKKDFRNRTQFGVNYSFSDNRDNASSDRDSDAYFGPSDPFNFLALDWGRSQLDITHQFSFFGYFELPAKLQLSTLVAARSGRPFPAYSSRCGDPGVADGSPESVFENSFQCSSNFNTIRPVQNGALLERYPFTTGAYFRWDFRLSREFSLSANDDALIRFTFEVFNLTNAGNYYSNPVSARNAILGDPNFMQLDQTPGPVSAQFGLKLVF